MEHQKFIGSFEAKTKFANIINEVTNNATNYVITKRGEPVAIIKPYVKEKTNNIAEAINNFINYRDTKGLDLRRKKDFSLKSIVHYNHKYE